MELKSRLEFVAFRAFVALLTVLPRPLALRVGAAVGQLAFWLAAPLRRIALVNLAIAFPEKSLAERRRILAASCRNLGRVAVEFCHLPRLAAADVDRFVAVEDRAAWENALRLGAERGAVIVTGHFGNWELLAYVHGLLGHPVTIVHKPMRNRWVDAAVMRVRTGAGTRSIPKRAAAREALRTLRRRELLVIPTDQNQRGHEGVFVDLYGVPACTNPGAARLARHTGAAILPVFLVREGETERHRLVVLPEIEPSDTGDPERDVVSTTQACSDAVADMIRRHPEQWIWFHRRWRTRRPGEKPVY